MDDGTGEESLEAKEQPEERRPEKGSCPILDGQERLAGISVDMRRTLRQLRRDLLACRSCAHVTDCPVLAQFQAVVESALQEVWDEWNSGQATG